MLRCGSLPTKACMGPRACQALTLHHALFASASASAPRLPADFWACSIAATASAKNSSSSAESLSRSRVTTMTGMTTSLKSWSCIGHVLIMGILHCPPERVVGDLLPAWLADRVVGPFRELLVRG